jgi:DNA-directed RNA polymerase subunit N (RpoN/RPB10)
MYPYIRCCTCNNSLGEYIELYELLKNDLNKKELNKIYNGNYNPSQTEIDHINNIISSEILDFLKIEKWCCRRILTTNVNFDSLIYSSINN